MFVREEHSGAVRFVDVGGSDVVGVEIGDQTVEGFSLLVGGTGVESGVDEVVGESGEFDVGDLDDLLGDSEGLVKGAAEAVEAGVDFEVEEGGLVHTRGGGTEQLGHLNGFDENVESVEGSLVDLDF